MFHQLTPRDWRKSVEAREFTQRARTDDPDIPLVIWELRMSRWHADSPTRDVILEILRALWAETEGMEPAPDAP